MSRITPIDIENKQFKKSVFGFSKSSVDEFLDELLESYEQIYKENISLKDKVNNLNDVVIYYKGMEDTLKNTIIVAEKAGEEILQVARKNAEQIESEAHINAKTIIGKAEDEARVMNLKREQLVASYDSVRAQMYEYLKTQLALTVRDDEGQFMGMEM